MVPAADPADRVDLLRVVLAVLLPVDLLRAVPVDLLRVAPVVLPVGSVASRRPHAVKSRTPRLSL